MATLVRLYTFTPNTTISSAQVNAEFNQIVGTLNGTVTTKDVYIGSATPPTTTTPKFMVNGQSSFVLNGSGTTIAVWREGDNPVAVNPRVSISNLGSITVVASQNLVTPANAYMRLDGVMYCYNGGSTTIGGAVGNVGTGEDDLMNFDVAENVLNGQQQFIHIVAAGTTAANANNKTIKFYVKTTAVLNSGAIAANAKSWQADIHIFSYGGTSTVLVVGWLRLDTTIVYCCQEVTSFDHTATNTTKFTGTATATDDILQSVLLVRKGMSA